MVKSRRNESRLNRLGGSPVRTCIGCRERFAQDELVRLNLRDGKVVIVAKPGASVGRSIYLCPREKCFDAMARIGKLAFSRSKHNRIVVRLEETKLYILKNRFLSFIKTRNANSVS